MILVARRFGFSMWLMIWEAASLPSWPAPMSIDVNCGEVSLANKELLKEMIDRSSGIARWFSRQTLSKENGEDIVADQDCCRAVFLHKEPAVWLLRYSLIHSLLPRNSSGRTGSWWLASASW